MTLTPSQFVARWRGASLSERSGAQSHFMDLCQMLGQPHPAEADSVGERFTFEKSVRRTSGGKGFADVWLRDHFAWEYKGKHKDLAAAYKQLNDYRENLGNPPLLVVCDFDRFEVHTNFTSTTKRVYAFNLDDLNHNQVTAACPLPPIEVLRALFGDYSVLRPEYTDARVTQDAAKLFSRLAERLELEERNLGANREQVAHFLMRLLFCLFADSIGLLPDRVFRKLLQSDDRFNPKRFLRKLTSLFEAMSQRDGIFGEHTIKYFNGGLFDTASIIQLDKADLGILYEVSKNYDWSHIAPAIFGTLFERSLDRARRSLIGAHYTSEDDIRLLVEPVIMRPLQERWAAVRQRLLEALEIERAEEAAQTSPQARLRPDRKSERLLAAWIEELTSIRVLDPACGSGNFLYVALRRMSDLWLEARRFAAEQGISLVVPNIVSPRQLYGIETEFYAHELASIVVWIGFLQWRHEHGVVEDREPILQKLDNIQHADAILRYQAEGNPYEPEWPKVDFIIGNPPFLGGKYLRRGLGDAYVNDLFSIYEHRVKAESDLVVYWFEKARAQVEKGFTKRVGLLATQAIRAGANRNVLDRIQEKGNIFWAWSNRPWLLEGADVRVSMIGFDGGEESLYQLDGCETNAINANLTSGIDLTQARCLAENRNTCYMGTTKVGAFDLEPEVARKMLQSPINVNGRPNSDVVRPWINAKDYTARPRRHYIIDFGTDLTEAEAALYELPFQYVRKHVYARRRQNSRESYGEFWWRHGEPRPELRRAMADKPRCILTPRVSKHRTFTWLDAKAVADSRLFVFTRSDDYFFGILHSQIHELWSVATSSRHGVGNDLTYNSGTCFETFPFPWPPRTEPSEDESPITKAIADAARNLIRLRNAWLNPPDTREIELKRRTLTNLYNERPAWLEIAHQALDRAVFAAYGLTYPLTRNEILHFLLMLNRERAAGHVRVLSPELPPKKVPLRQKQIASQRGQTASVGAGNR